MRTELSLKYAQLKHQAVEKLETNQALAAFRKFKGKCTNCRKFRHKSNECHSKTRNSKGEGAETDKANQKRVLTKVQSSVSPAGSWVIISQNAPSLSPKRVKTSSRRRRIPF